ncbi:MAG: REP-associated tyrosine transposase [Gammaproteobacteria bacterium]|nr:transposase [Gammaproteobacteria bacterium]
MPDYRRYYLPGHAVFITIVTYDRKCWLTNDAAVNTLLSSMRRVKTLYPFRHVAHAVLPDHLHWMLEPTIPNDLPRIVAAVKRDVTWHFKDSAQTPARVWQKRYYDHVIRDDEDFARHLDYIHYNPVKHGYCRRPLDYPHTSFAEWLKRGVYTADWGETEPDDLKSMNLE